jgi:molybdopterin molybdotransferase
MRAVLRYTASGVEVVTPLQSQDSSLLSVLAQANCLLVRPVDGPALAAGTPVPVLPMDF